MTYPTIRPALTLDFAKTQLLDPRIAFTRSSTGTYLDSDGLIKTAPSGVARFEYDSSGNALGLLIEEGRTNNFLNSNDCTQWSPFRVNVGTDTGVVAPDGSTSVGWVESRLGSSGGNVKGGTFSNTTGPHSMFVWAKHRAGAPWIAIGPGQPGSQKYAVFFNLATGQIGSAGSGLTGEYEMIPYPNGWYKIVFTGCNSQGTTFQMWPSDADGTTGTHTTTGSHYLWGAQVEDLQGFPTSYIPTSGSTATRAADLATMPTAGIFGDDFTTINDKFGTVGGSHTLTVVGPNAERSVVYPAYLTQAEINKLAAVDDFWRWRVLGSSFALPNFSTDGQVTVDWGDGTVETLTTSEHTFSNGSGYHEIGFRLDSGTYFGPRVSQFQDRVVSLGPAPSSMKVDANQAFIDQTNLLTVDSIIKFRGIGDLMFRLYPGKSIGYIDTSEVTRFNDAWRASSLTSFPAIDFSGATLLKQTWEYCGYLTSFGVINTSTITSFQSTWKDCSGLTSFPLIDTSSGTSFSNTWRSCTSLTSFPSIDTSSGTIFSNTWMACSSLTSFPSIDLSSGTSFYGAWYGATSLATFPANMFDTTGTLDSTAFQFCWYNCALTAASIENILVSLDTNGASNITLHINGGTNAGQSTWTSAATTAYNNLITKGWTITANP